MKKLCLTFLISILIYPVIGAWIILSTHQVFGQDKVQGSEVFTLIVTDWQPKGFAEERRPAISATFSSESNVAIDISSIEMFLNDSPVKPTVTGSGSEVTVTYIPLKLAEDTVHKVRIRARDVKGEVAEKTWTIYIPLVY
ncbi:MAG: hypothetical protein JRJ65_07615 [Deltaproteobacteria bacterium]|nr:hypothetical protein [Deltaproteobacteria bacterium]MBW1915174.1 hypothetical protein [Deltaproteobacteria bacterium]